MNRLFHNRFIQAVGVTVTLYVLFWLLSVSIGLIMQILQSVARWYQQSFIPFALQFSLIAGIAYLIISAVWHSRRDDE